MIKLVQSGVVFDEENHTYTLGDLVLQGITGMLGRQLFPHKFDNIPKYIVERAAERGSAIHKACEFADVTGFEPETTEAINYIALRTNSGYNALANEYTVTDKEHFASNIDCVWEKDGKIILADIKTTYKLDKEYVSWQLSIYAHLFELQNPGLKVDKLYGVWLRGEHAELVEVERKPTEQVILLMVCEIYGEQYTSKEIAKADDKAIMGKQAVDALLEVTELAAYYKNLESEMKDKLLQAMKENGVKSWDAGAFKATYTPPTTAIAFDSKKFKEENEALYNQYCKESQKKESIRITIRKEK